MLKTPLSNQKGLAMIEVVPILTIFVLLLNFAFGFFGIIHSGILQSIAARNYAFETFRNKTNLSYLRDIEGDSSKTFFGKIKYRYHGVVSESAPSNTEDWYVTQRPIRYTDVLNAGDVEGGSEHDKLKKIAERKLASEVVTEGVSPAWVRTLYGICLNSECGAGRRP